MAATPRSAGHHGHGQPSRVPDTEPRESTAHGAYQSRFESVISNPQAAEENQAPAHGRIKNADFAAETANLSCGQILREADMAKLTQANAMPHQVLSRLRS